MRHPLHLDRSYSTEMLRNKARLSAERVADSSRSVARWREIPSQGSEEKNAFPLKATRTS
jgi:hypothetical protein